MVKMRGRIAVAAIAASLAAPAVAVDLDELVGYTLVEKATIRGYVDESGEIEESFEGCEYDRVIVFDDGTALRCADYNYDYGYRPDAYIFVNGSSIKMVVDEEMYDMIRY